MWWMTMAMAMEVAADPLPEGCVATTAALPTPQIERLKGDRVLVVAKAARRLMLFDGGELSVVDGSPACWSVALGYDYPDGHKRVMGDRRTPEGWYTTSDRPWSAFYGAITIHYPGVEDAEAGARDGRITSAQRDSIVAAHRKGVLPPMETRLGGKILIHGGGNSADWTLGCVAMEDRELDGLRATLPKGMRTDVLILP
ncbi:MAG: L,D-transpeptidase family protein [Myxococcales bacterium]|nr:L,D-transpeptidase family protein [Myxococcales bacterium]